MGVGVRVRTVEIYVYDDSKGLVSGHPQGFPKDDQPQDKNSGDKWFSNAQTCAEYYADTGVFDKFCPYTDGAGEVVRGCKGGSGFLTNGLSLIIVKGPLTSGWIGQ
ncbi:unnamed protein product [Orchesella dallaii]|uniref:Uncharacterized protein n=1 Tax=Orchesella dallaii TaxID=48710 RepID=A0ABP1Q187_9HEXA